MRRTAEIERALAIAAARSSPERWNELQALLMQIAHGGEPVDQLVEDLDRLLASWPPDTRALSLNGAELPPERDWHWHVPSDREDAPWLRLVRHVDASVDAITSLPGSREDVLRAARSLRLQDARPTLDEVILSILRFGTLARIDLSSVALVRSEAATMGDLYDAMHAVGTTDLNLSRTNLEADDLRVLATHRLARELERLDVSALSTPVDRGVLVDACTTLIATGRLSSLATAYNGLGDSGGAEIMGVEGAARLQALDLGGNGIGDRTCMTLARRGAALNLRSLDIGGSAIGDRGLEALATGRGFAAAASLVLRDARLARNELQRLIDGDLASKLALLDLSGNRLTDACIPILVSTAFPHLRTLRLAVNRFSRAGIRKLEEWTAARGIDIEMHRSN